MILRLLSHVNSLLPNTRFIFFFVHLTPRPAPNQYPCETTVHATTACVVAVGFIFAVIKPNFLPLLLPIQPPFLGGIRHAAYSSYS